MAIPARTEREQLCDLALEVGPDAPTLSGDWTVRELLAHLVVRERSPLGAPGIVLPPLAGLTDRMTERTARKEFPALVRAVRRARTPLALPGVDALVNTLEFFVHHEDIRRARPGWTPRDLDRRTTSALWAAIRVAGRHLVRPAKVPVTIRRSDTGDRAVLRAGDDPVVLTGPVGELVLFLYGRAAVEGLEFTGPPESVAALQRASLGI